MKMVNRNIDVFIAFVRAGLWETSVKLLPYGEPNYMEVLRMAQNQAVVGLVAAGIEHVEDVKIPKEKVLQFVGQTLQLEQRNVAMNDYIRELINKLRVADIYTLLVKGQGVAQCYERPMWRASGDIDLLLDDANYRKSVDCLLPLSIACKTEGKYSKHLGLYLKSWYVELHGSLRSGLSTRVDRVIDTIQNDTFRNKRVRIWKNGMTDVYIPNTDNDVFFVFTHFLMHFFKEGGANLRQICDWCRLLWTYRKDINILLLEKRLY